MPRWWLSVVAMLPLNLMATAPPQICDLINSPSFSEMLGYHYGPATCGSPVPRPCARFSYYVPRQFIEVVSHPDDSFFKKLPGAKLQLQERQMSASPIYGAEDDMGAHSFHARTIRVPFATWAFSGMPCGGAKPNLFCYGTMSEHQGEHWQTGSRDRYQPSFLAWIANPKACLLKGAVTSATGLHVPGWGGARSMCSFPTPWLRAYPPSRLPVCNGWGVMFPRTGTVTSIDPVTASLAVATRIKSIGSEVYRSVGRSWDEKWQMVYPSNSGGFREGQSIAWLRARMVNDRGRVQGRQRSYLYAIWHRVSCKRDLYRIASTKAWIAGIKQACGGAN